MCVCASAASMRTRSSRNNMMILRYTQRSRVSKMGVRGTHWAALEKVTLPNHDPQLSAAAPCQMFPVDGA